MSIQQTCIEALVKDGFIVIDVRQGIPEEVRSISRLAVEQTGLIGFLDRFFVLLRERQQEAIQEDQLRREYAGRLDDLNLAEFNESRLADGVWPE